MVIYYITAYYTMEKQKKKKWQQSLQQPSQRRAHKHQMQFNYMPQEYFLEALFPFKNFAKKKSSPERHSLASLGCLQDRYPLSRNGFIAIYLLRREELGTPNRQTLRDFHRLSRWRTVMKNIYNM